MNIGEQTATPPLRLPIGRIRGVESGCRNGPSGMLALECAAPLFYRRVTVTAVSAIRAVSGVVLPGPAINGLCRLRKAMFGIFAE